MDRKPRILFYFLHLLGVGHVFRAQRLIEGFSRHGFAVDVIYGGEVLEEVEFAAETIHFLSPIRAADNSYSTYLDADGQQLDKPFQLQRADEIEAIFDQLTPDIVMIEAFPFGRRMVRLEMEVLLKAVQKRQPKPIVISSVRDILQERKKPGRVEETCDWIDQYFDQVLVHSDSSVIQLDSTFPLASRIRDKFSYSGFVVPPRSTIPVMHQFDVIVSAGGGAFGGELLATALNAAKQRSDWSWCLSSGPNLDADQFRSLADSCPPHVTLTRYLPDLAEQMKQARLSISQCGYNTAMDALAAHRDSACRAVFVPYDTEGQSEQLRRAEILQKGGYAICLPQSSLTEERLLQSCEQALKLDRVDHQIDFDGVNNSAKLLQSWLNER
ncbi:MAG: glycosyl transferase [Rhizobiaceae bacterium]|nr:glycosyl transferase [Rhizobiaceae bacterium]